MPPLFPPRSNFFARASIAAGLVLLVAVTAFAVWYLHSPTFTKVGVPVAQPVPFPHNFHVSGLGLDCRYCHATVDKSNFADFPPTETCMTCHSVIDVTNPALEPVRQSWKTGQPIVWKRVTVLPDFVYFDHHIHVDKGIGCETCHGRVDQMTTDVKVNTFFMAWCLKCHRYPSEFIRPVDKVYEMGYTPAIDQAVLGPQLVKDYNILASDEIMKCSTCHR